MKVNRPIIPVKKKISITQHSTPENVSTSSDAPLSPTFKLQKLLAQKGLGFRREMEALIAADEVSLNSKTTTLGDRAG